MSPNPYSENLLVEQPAIRLFGEIGWQTINAEEEVIGTGGTLGRETTGDVVLAGRLSASLGKINPTLPASAIQTAVDELTKNRSTMSPVTANREIYMLLKEGVKVTIQDKNSGEHRTERLRVIDWEQPENNDFLLVSQLSVTGELYKCRPDLVGFVNGLPLVVIELKKPAVPAQSAFDENITHYKKEIPKLFWYNALLIASNGTDSRVGSLTADWERFFEWKRVESESEPRRVSLEVMIRGTCDPKRLLDMVENFTLFSEHKDGVVKIIGQNHQFLGVNNAIASMLEARKLGHGKAGVFWQTQGSGKSFSMVFFAQKVLRKLQGNWSFVVVTDRLELDDQIAKTFKNTGAVTKEDSENCHATSGAHLRELLSGNQRYVFTLIQKFQTRDMLTDRSDVIVLTDEAHRSQYDTLALNMRASLPKAMFLAFTGTPLIAGEERTKEIFGDYVSIYDFQQSIEDGATVPLFHENRTPELKLVNPNLDNDIRGLIDDAELDPEQESKLEQLLGKQYHILTREERLEVVAEDIVKHFLGRGFIGKAMVVSIDKATALKMRIKVGKHWDAEKTRVQRELGNYGLPEEQKEALKRRLELLNSTEMALIVSPSQNEIEQMRRLGLDIEPHRKQMKESNPPLDERFKDTKDPLRIAFVCAMWLTGFDAPSCSTIYLDKPMRNHSLMQTIARANRVFPGKHNGLIVDYANVLTSLEAALAIYGAGNSGTSPVKDKAELVKGLREAVADATAFCAAHKVDLVAMEKLPTGDLSRLAAVEAAINALISPDGLRKDFFAHLKLCVTLYQAIKPDKAALEFYTRIKTLTTIGEAIRLKLSPNPPDISDILLKIDGLLDASIAGAKVNDNGPKPMDLSKVDFKALAERFKDSKTKNIDIERLKAAIRAKLEKLVRLNRTRTDFTEKFEEMIDSYNSGSRNIEELYRQLVDLTRSLDEEEERHARENLSEEELAVFDILTRPAPDLSAAEREKVKKVAKDLLERLKGLLVLNWRNKIAAKSAVKLAIEDYLETGLPEKYEKPLFEEKCRDIFEHVYESYPERDSSVYASVA